VRLRPLSGLLHQPRVIIMSVERSVEWELAGETEVLEETLPKCHFVHYKSHMTWPGLEPEPPRLGSRRLTAWAMARHRLKSKSVPYKRLRKVSAFLIWMISTGFLWICENIITLSDKLSGSVQIRVLSTSMLITMLVPPLVEFDAAKYG
jgi:hypothetical protein